MTLSTRWCTLSSCLVTLHNAYVEHPNTYRVCRWSEVITHVPCGGNSEYPAGRLLISSTLEAIDGVGGTLGSAGATNIWNSCPSISLLGAMRFDIDDIDGMEEDGTFEGVILHEMGHVIGIGYVN